MINSFEFLPTKGACGLLGIIRKKNAPKISNAVALKAIECVRFRGSKLGAGFACFNHNDGFIPPYRVKAFVNCKDTAKEVREILSNYANRGLEILSEKEPEFRDGDSFSVYTLFVEAKDIVLYDAINEVNEEMWKDGIKARIYSSARYSNVYKGVGYPLDVAKRCGLLEDRIYADAWLAHTRQPTNSPGRYPVWSHPFSSFECSIIHNGDISSFGSNMEFLNALGMRSHVGTDSEVIARILDYLVRVKGLSMLQAAQILSNPYERVTELLPDEGKAIRELIISFRGAELDGPFSVIAGYSDGKDTYLLGLVDRSKFRPMVVGEDDRGIYIASEECQIKLIAPEAKIWTPKPGGFVLASVKKGLIEAGREDRELFYGFTNSLSQIQLYPTIYKIKEGLIDASKLDYHELNKAIREEFEKGVRDIYLLNVKGQRYIGASLMKPEFYGKNIHIYGTPGNCLANFNMGLNFYVYGNAEDNVGDTMHAGKVIIHGDARDVIAQAFQGGDIFVRGSVGNRAGIQMREYRDKRPYFIIGGRVDDYFCEYMAGGIAILLGFGKKSEDSQITGGFVGTGMVGGKIYIRAKVRQDTIGLPPKKADVLNYLNTLLIDGSLDEETYKKIIDKEWISYNFLKETLSPNLFERVKRFYIGKYVKPLRVEYRELNSTDSKLLEPKLREYFEAFKLSDKLFEEVLGSKFTVITTEEEALKEDKEAIAEE
ncbi:MAG: hypothetical protein QXX95_05835 [Nitrososphaerales archaeon]